VFSKRLVLNTLPLSWRVRDIVLGFVLCCERFSSSSFSPSDAVIAADITHVILAWAHENDKFLLFS